MKFNKSYLFKQKQIQMMSLSTMVPKGITVHNTANRNHASARQESANVYNNNTKKGWNGVAVHFFVDENEIYQVLPLNVHGWHAGDGGKGFGNRQTIAIEICRSLDYKTERYAKAEKKSAELVAWLMKEYNIPITQVKRHYDYATNKKRCPHRMFEGKPNTWTKYLDLVKEAEKGSSKPIIPSDPVSTLPISEVVKKVRKGDYGNGLERVINLEKAGYNYDEIQKLVNKAIADEKSGKFDLKPKPEPKPKPKPVKKSNREVALEIYRGRDKDGNKTNWGNNPGRKKKLEAAGYNYNDVQKIVNSFFKK